MIEDASFRKLINNSECPEKLKYDFNKNGELKHVDTNEPFVFNYQNSYNHKRYQILGQLHLEMWPLLPMAMRY
uniref:Arb2 domain-containing protein n=1 Tax=Naja naja TaxID=35670 RepID=A0A8C6XD95_NAJNA